MRISSARARWMTLAVLLGISLIGCGFLDSAVGVDPSGETKPGVSKPGGTGSPLGTVGSLLGIWFPWAAAAATTLGGIYATIRKRKYLTAVNSIASGINIARKQHAIDGKIDVLKLMESLSQQQDRDGVRDLVRGLVHKLEGDK